MTYDRTAILKMLFLRPRKDDPYSFETTGAGSALLVVLCLPFDIYLSGYQSLVQALPFKTDLS